MTEPSKTTVNLLAKTGYHHGLGHTLSTVEATFARSALAELNTHRALSKNSASSRAIPVKKMLAAVEESPFIPRRFSLAQKGMHASEFVTPSDGQWEDTVSWWLDSRDQAVASAKKGLDISLHKQDVNRILEPFMLHTAIISGTEWENFFDLRLAKDENGNPLAYPPIYDLAYAIREEIYKHKTNNVVFTKDYSHLPLISTSDMEALSPADVAKVSAARCARVSYTTHHNERNLMDDINLFDRLVSSGHYSPLEHVAKPSGTKNSNFDGWHQLRKDYER